MQTGYVVPSSLVFRTISRFAAQQLEDHHRFLAFADMAGIDVFATKTAAQVTPEEQYIEKSKEKRHRGRDKALSRGFAQGIQDMLEDHLPFKHFEYGGATIGGLDDDVAAVLGSISQSHTNCPVIFYQYLNNL